MDCYRIVGRIVFQEVSASVSTGSRSEEWDGRGNRPAKAILRLSRELEREVMVELEQSPWVWSHRGGLLLGPPASDQRASGVREVGLFHGLLDGGSGVEVELVERSSSACKLLLPSAAGTGEGGSSGGLGSLLAGRPQAGAHVSSAERTEAEYLEVICSVAQSLRSAATGRERIRAVLGGLRRAFPGISVTMRHQPGKPGPNAAPHLAKARADGIEILRRNGSRLRLRGDGLADAKGETGALFLESLAAMTELASRPARARGVELGKWGDFEGMTLPSGAVIVGSHPHMQELFGNIQRIAPRLVTVLINGETGTGKELMARALHELSDRREGPFVAVNCAALPNGLIENELFGHQPGSFTGASSRSHLGLVESASGGTLFLDEVSSMPMELQSRLLRVLEQKSVRRLGESRERAVDIRVVAATNQPLHRLVAQGLFRHDLYHRLHVVRLTVPPLRERRSDIRLLAEHRLNRISKREGETKRLSRDAVHSLSSYWFPGNVRELFNLVEGAYHLSDEEVIGPAHFLDRLEPERPAGSSCGQADDLYLRLCQGSADFWRDVRDSFLARDLCRRQVRQIVSKGMEEVGGSYRRLIGLFHLPSSDYHRFLAFLTHHRCKVDFRKYRAGPL